jgi:hypothetical protein
VRSVRFDDPARKSAISCLETIVLLAAAGAVNLSDALLSKQK